LVKLRGSKNFKTFLVVFIIHSKERRYISTAIDLQK